MKITYFVHSITKDNEAGLATGWPQGELSDEGVKRAKGLASDLQSRGFDAVFCSDLKRAMDSTELFFGGTLPVFVDWRLRECNYGELDGRPTKEFKKDREQEYIDTPYPGGESYHDVEKRIRSFVLMPSDYLLACTLRSSRTRLHSSRLMRYKRPNVGAGYRKRLAQKRSLASWLGI